MKPKSRMIFICIALFLCGTVVIGVKKWFSESDKRDISNVTKIFLWKTNLVLPSDTQILGGKNFSSRDIILEIVIAIPKEKMSEFKKNTPIDMITFKTDEYDEGEKWFLSHFSINMGKLEEIGCLEYGEVFCERNDGYFLAVYIANRYKANIYTDKYVVYLKYQST